VRSTLRRIQEIKAARPQRRRWYQMFKLACGDVMPGCAARFEHTDKDRMLAGVAAHAASAHGITTITPEILSLIDSKVVVAA
jgi:predicted small metal-binding protein